MQHDTSTRREPGSQHIASGPASQAEQCQGRVDIKRPRRQVENDEYGAFVRRVLRAYAAVIRKPHADIGQRENTPRNV
jgi:hypothetical protein